MKHKYTNKTQLLVCNYYTFFPNRLTFGTQNEPSTQLTNATSCVKNVRHHNWTLEHAAFLPINRRQWTKIQKHITSNEACTKSWSIYVPIAVNLKNKPSGIKLLYAVWEIFHLAC